MESFSATINYIFAFLSVYIQVFLLYTFLERRKHIVIRSDDEKMTLSQYPTVSIIVPCYNEEKTIKATVDSLLQLEYPKDKLKIILVDDGSKDNTWSLIQEFSSHPQIESYRKENGGKHTAMNFALEKISSEFVGGLDADSFVHPQALVRIIKMFDDKEIMAISPSIIVHEPKNIIQKAQKAEYDMSVYNKKMFGFLGAIHVTPGPFSIFRKKVFDDLGPYRKAHNTEDQEIALRMQEAGYRIDHCPDAYVYTVSPNSVAKLYRQRLRWIYGFIKNAFDYRRLIFRKKYGPVGTFTLPSGAISILSVIFLSGIIVYNFITYLVEKIIEIRTVGFDTSWNGFHFDFFYFNTKAIIFVTVILYGMVVIALLLGRRMSEGKYRISMDMLYFVFVYSLVAPIWLLKAVWNAIWSKESSWTFERKVESKS